jgi:hypothetical protein
MALREALDGEREVLEMRREEEEEMGRGDRIDGGEREREKKKIHWRKRG